MPRLATLQAAGWGAEDWSSRTAESGSAACTWLALDLQHGGSQKLAPCMQMTRSRSFHLAWNMTGFRSFHLACNMTGFSNFALRTEFNKFHKFAQCLHHDGVQQFAPRTQHDKFQKFARCLQHDRFQTHAPCIAAARGSGARARGVRANVLQPSAHKPAGKVSGASPASQCAVRSSGCRARVPSKCSTASNCRGRHA